MVNVAILGFGVVGSGVAEVLATNGSHIDKKVDDLIRAVPFSRAPEVFSTRSGERVKIVLTHDDQ